MSGAAKDEPASARCPQLKTPVLRRPKAYGTGLSQLTYYESNIARASSLRGDSRSRRRTRLSGTSYPDSAMFAAGRWPSPCVQHLVTGYRRLIAIRGSAVEAERNCISHARIHSRAGRQRPWPELKTERTSSVFALCAAGSVANRARMASTRQH